MDEQNNENNCVGYQTRFVSPFDNKKTTVSDAILSETQFVMLQLMLFIKCSTKDTNIKKKKPTQIVTKT